MGSLGEMVCHGGLRAMAIQVRQSNTWLVMGGMVVKVCLRVAWAVACLSWVAWVKWCHGGSCSKQSFNIHQSKIKRVNQGIQFTFSLKLLSG